MGGNVESAIYGAITGGITAGAEAFTYRSDWAVRAMVKGIAGGINAGINARILSGDTERGFKFALLASMAQSGFDAYVESRLSPKHLGYRSSIGTATGGATLEPSFETAPTSIPTQTARNPAPRLPLQPIAVGIEAHPRA